MILSALAIKSTACLWDFRGEGGERRPREEEKEEDVMRSCPPGCAAELGSIWGTCSYFPCTHSGMRQDSAPEPTLPQGSQVPSGKPCLRTNASCPELWAWRKRGRPGPRTEWALSLSVTSTSLVCRFVCGFASPGCFSSAFPPTGLSLGPAPPRAPGFQIFQSVAPLSPGCDSAGSEGKGAGLSPSQIDLRRQSAFTSRGLAFGAAYQGLGAVLCPPVGHNQPHDRLCRHPAQHASRLSFGCQEELTHRELSAFVAAVAEFEPRPRARAQTQHLHSLFRSQLPILGFSVTPWAQAQSQALRPASLPAVKWRPRICSPPRSVRPR